MKLSSLVEALLDVCHAIEVHLGVASVHGRVLDLELLGEVVEGLDLGLQPGHGEEGGQVGRVGGDDDEAEQPPGGGHQAAGQSSGRFPPTCRTPEHKAWLTLRASLSGTFLQTLPDLVTPLKGYSLSPRCCPVMRSAPSERFGY